MAQRIQQVSGSNTVFGSSVATPAFVSTKGNILIAAIEADTVAQNGITVTDNQGNVWQRVISVSLAATFDLEIWIAYVKNGGAGCVVTATDNGGGVDSLIIVEEWSGQDVVNPSDKSAGTSAITTTALNSGSSGALSKPFQLIICAGVASGVVTLTPGGNFSNLTQIATTFTTLGFESQIVDNKAAVTGVMTSSASGSNACEVITIPLKLPQGFIKNALRPRAFAPGIAR